MNGLNFETTRLSFVTTSKGHQVSAVLMRPPRSRWLLLLGHGAGAGMEHPFMRTLSIKLAQVGVATFRYQFPFMERGTKIPDSQEDLISTVMAALEMAGSVAPDLPLLVGGKSMGGRMTSLAISRGGLARVQGLVFVGFPLHAAGRPSTTRGDHLKQIPLPLLFLQGSRDRLGSLELIRSLCRNLGDRVRLHVVEDADHSFHMTKRSGRNDEGILGELACVVADWAEHLQTK